jgi:hypothetical protein
MDATAMKIKPLTKRQLAKFAPKEDDDLRLLAIYLDRRFGEHGWIHVANERKTSWRNGKALKAKGQKKGFPDVIIFVGPSLRVEWLEAGSKPYKGMVIELKRITELHSKGGGLTKEQKEWLTAMANHGHITGVCYGLDEAIEFVERYYGKGYLVYERAGRMKQQSCRNSPEHPCGDWCPSFHEPQFDETMFGTGYIRICDDRAEIEGEIADERVTK